MSLKTLTMSTILWKRSGRVPGLLVLMCRKIPPGVPLNAQAVLGREEEGDTEVSDHFATSVATSYHANIAVRATVGNNDKRTYPKCRPRDSSLESPVYYRFWNRSRAQRFKTKARPKCILYGIAESDSNVEVRQSSSSGQKSHKGLEKYRSARMVRGADVVGL